ncbi:MAG: ATP-binding cassette domain-containing protein [Halieaceae bacterium]
MSVLRLDAIEKSYSGTPVLAQTSLEFAQNKITAIIGRSGCGKSTLLRVCNGLVTPDRGAVELFGQPLDYNNLPALRRRLGYAVQGVGLFPHFDIRKNITLLARLEGWDDAKIDHRLHELLQLTHLEEEKLTAYPHQLSGGQQQRVGLCRAMMLHPEVMLLDEPFAAIDPITRIDMHRQLLELHQAEPSTVVLVTHDMHEAMRLADHIVVMSQGKIDCQRTTASLREENPGVGPDELLLSLLGGAE